MRSSRLAILSTIRRRSSGWISKMILNAPALTRHTESNPDNFTLPGRPGSAANPRSVRRIRRASTGVSLRA